MDMKEWNDDKALFSLIKEELYTAVIGDIMDKMVARSLWACDSRIRKSVLSRMFEMAGLASRSFTFCVRALGTQPFLRSIFQMCIRDRYNKRRLLPAAAQTLGQVVPKYQPVMKFCSLIRPAIISS